jgi:hypothetical protein
VLKPLPALLALTAALVIGGFAARDARADTYAISVVACENIAPYLDGDPNDATTPADEQAACLDPIPPTGALSIAALESTLADPDGVLDDIDLEPLDVLDGNRIPQTCTYDAVITQQTVSPVGCTLLVFVFVDDEKPTTLDLPAGLASIENGPVDALCSVDGLGLGQDYDCADPPDLNGDGVVVFHVLNANSATGDEKVVRGLQETIEVSAIVRISDLPRFDEVDPDSDGIPADDDNCPYDANVDQLNNDGGPIVTAGLPNDNTRPYGDDFGDACDDDDDNDELPDFVETSLAPGNGFHAICPTTPADTNPLNPDTDGDRVLDLAECFLGSNPLDPNSKPPPPAQDSDFDGLDDTFENGMDWNPLDSDSDDDGIPDGIEFKGYNTSPGLPDTDFDGCTDAREITSLDGNTVTNSIDLVIVAQNFNNTTRANVDINKNGIVNAIDLAIVAQNFSSSVCVD